MDNESSNLQRDPKQWKSGAEHMTDAQRLVLDSLANQTGEPTPDDSLTKAEASQRIEELRSEAGISDEDDDTDTVLGDED